jgi:hypothetical protein
MHTGHMTELSQVIDFFSRGGDAPGGYPGMNELARLDLDEEQRTDLAAFIGALQGEGPAASLLEPLP